MSLDKLRALPEFQNASDAEILGTISKTTQVPITELASVFGVDAGSKWGNRASASIDNYQAGLLGVGEAITGGTSLEGFFRQGRERNEAEANLARANAQRQGAIMSYKDVNGIGDAADWIGGLAVDSLPYLAESAAGGVLGRVALAGGKTALGLSRAAAGTVGGVAASYPSAVGDILQNQREENGTTDVGTAALGGVGYAGLNALGLTGAASRAGGLRRAGVDLLDNTGGVKGAALRTAVAFGKNALEEGVGETGQELINQSFGRMAVNPEQTLFNPEANERYLESFIGGAALGGSVGAGMGGWRRSEGYQPKGVTLPSDQSLDDPATPADLLGSTQNQAPAALGFSGYNTGVGELVSFPDGSVMLRSEYEARRAKGLAPDGSVEFVPPAMSDMFQRSEPYQYEGAVPFELIPPQPPGVMPTERPAPLSQVPVAGIDGNQLDLFSLQEAPLNQFSQLPQAQEITATPRDTLTRDMLVESPTAMVPTMFNPLNESQQVGSRGAVAGNIRSQLRQQLGGAGDMTVATQLSLDIASNLGNLGAMTAAVDARQQAIEKNLVALDRKVSGDSNMLSPEEYATRREALENKLLTAEAARTLLTRYQQAQTNAYADEARGRGQPGQTVGAVPESNATETEMRDNSMRAAVAETDARVQQGEMDRRQDDQAKGRMAVLRQVLSEPTRSKPVARFRKALRDAGFTNLDVTPAEQVEIDRVSSRRADVRDATVVPPGLAAANNLLIPRSTFDGAVPSPTPQDATDVQNQPQPVAATTGAEAVSQPAQAATAMGAQPASQATRVPAARTTAVETSGVTNPALGRTIPSYALYQVTEAPAYPNLAPMSAESADAELQALEEQAANGALSPEIFGRSEVAKRLGADVVAQIGAGIERDPMGAIRGLRQAVAPASAPVVSQPNQAPVVSQPAATQAAGTRPAGQTTVAPTAVETSGLTEYADIAAEETPPTTKAKPTRANKKVAIESSVQDLMDAVDAATDELEYDGAVDALYRRYMEGSDEDTDAVLDYVQAQPKSFSKDWSAAEKRYDDTERGVTGTRGLAQKNDAPTSDQIKKSVESDMLRGVWTRFSQGAVQPAGKSVSLERVQQIVQQVLGKLGIAGVVRVEAFRNPTAANLTTPDGVVPAGVTLNGGRILLFADNIGSDIDVFRTLFHELFHLGLSKSLGQTAYIQQMLKFKLDPLVNKYALRWKGTADGQNRKGKLPVNNYEALAVEEALADIAEDLATDKLGSKELQPFVRSMIGKLASIAQAVGLDKVAQALRRMTYTQAEKFVMDTVLGANYAAPTQLRGKRFGPGVSAFKRWFGDSKVVGADGKPLVVYHGTNADISAFDASKLGTASGADSAKMGFFFASNPAVASSYADTFNEYRDTKLGRILAKLTGGLFEPFSEALLRTVGRSAIVSGGNVMPVYLAIKNPKIVDFRGSPYREKTYAQIISEAKSEGHDGLILRNTFDEGYVDGGDQITDVYVAFEPTQIKSAIGNNGNFDPTNPDIRFRQANTEAELRALDKEGGTPAAMVERLSKTPMGYMVRNTLGSWRKRHGVLGWLTMDQIKDRFAEFPAVVKAADKVLFMGSRANALLRSPTALHRQWAKFARENKGEVANNLNNLFIRSTLAEAWVDGDMEPRLDPRNKHIDFTDPKKAAAVAKARTLYVSLPKEGQEIYKRVTAELDKQFRAKQEAILKRVVDVYRDSLAKVASPEELMEIARGGMKARANFRGTALPGMTMRERLEFQKFGAALDSMYVPRNEVPGPYFPLTRRGDHVVVFKAKSYVALNKALEDARANLDKLLGEDVPLEDKALEEHSKRVADARKAVADARKALEDAKGDGTQYVVKFFEGAAQAEDGAAELRKELGHLGEVTQTLRRAFTHNTDSVPAGFMAKLQDQMVKSLPEDSREDVASAVRQMIIQSLPERSAFKAELKRMRVEGVDPVDAMYSFVSASSRNAWTTSRLENATDLAEAMVKASSSDDYDERIVGNELVKRYAQSLEYKESNALIDAASNLSYITNLGFSPGYYMQNMLQPWMISLPVMAGRFGVRNASTAMSDATVDVVKAIHATIKEGKVNGNWEMPLDLSKFSKTEQELLERMVSEGRIDITMRADMGSGSTATGEVSHYLQRASELSSLPAHMVEVTNRVATALAAFRLVQRNGGNVDEALAYAEKVVVQTHVDYSVENAPRFMSPSSMGGFGKLAFQFKRYQQAMVFLWFKLVIDSVRHGRKEDALALLYLSGSNFAMAGLSGLPIAAPMGLALAGLSAAFGDEEDDEDWGEMLWSGVRGVIGETATDVLRKGVPTAIGIDISSKVGQGGILSPIFKMPNANTGEGVVSGLGFQLVFGASGAMLGNWADAVMLSKDNPALAVQKLMPRGAKDFMEAVRRDYDGLTDRKGKVLLDEAEVDFGDTLVKALGLESVKVTNLYDRRSAIMDAEYARQDVRTRLMSKYTKARIAGDAEEMADIRSDIDAFNKRNPRDVQILPKNLVASYKQELVRRREMQNGVRVTKRNRDIVEQYSAD